MVVSPPSNHVALCTCTSCCIHLAVITSPCTHGPFPVSRGGAESLRQARCPQPVTFCMAPQGVPKTKKLTKAKMLHTGLRPTNEDPKPELTPKPQPPTPGCSEWISAVHGVSLCALTRTLPPHAHLPTAGRWRICCWANTQIARSRACFRQDQRASPWLNHTPKCPNAPPLPPLTHTSHHVCLGGLRFKDMTGP